MRYGNSGKWQESMGKERYRRGLYIHYQRTTPYPFLANFDEPDAGLACSRRRVSDTPLQSLNLLNDPVFFEAAQALAKERMRLAFTYQGERLKENVQELTSTLPGSLLLPCDVTNDAEIDAVFKNVGDEFGKLDVLVHSVAFAQREDLENEFAKTSRDGFKLAQDISAYSLVAMTRAALPLMERAGGGSVLAMTYYGAVKAVEGYNVMGVAKASLEASVRYLAANLGPKNIRVNAISPLRRNVELEEIGNAALFLASPMSSGITGEVLYVDCGYNIIGL